MTSSCPALQLASSVSACNGRADPHRRMDRAVVGPARAHGATAVARAQGAAGAAA